MSINIEIMRVGGIEVPEPVYATAGAAAFDVCAAIATARTLEVGQRALIPTGLALAIPEGYEAQVRPRSGLAFRYGLSIVNSPGTIDADYRGEVGILLINLGQEPVTIAPLDRIAQLVVAPVVRATFKWVEALSTTDRGAGGFGSTGR